jgi:hypothetical protein
MAGSKSSLTGEDFYGMYDAQVRARVSARASFRQHLLSCVCVRAHSHIFRGSQNSPARLLSSRNCARLLPDVLPTQPHNQPHTPTRTNQPPSLQEAAIKHAPELGMQAVPSLDVVYTEEAGYVTADAAAAQGLHVKKLSGTKFRQMLRAGEEIPEWFAFKSVVRVLREHAQHGGGGGSPPRA